MKANDDEKSENFKKIPEREGKLLLQKLVLHLKKKD